MFVRFNLKYFEIANFRSGHFHGSVFVTMNARLFLESMLLPTKLAHYIIG